MPSSGTPVSPAEEEPPCNRPIPYVAPTGTLRHNRNFRVFLTGSTVSVLGSRLTTIAYPMLVLWLTRSPVYAGLAVFAATVPSIMFYIPAGALADRRDPRRTMLWAEISRGTAVTLIVITVVLHRSSVPLIIALATIEKILEVFAGLAERRYIMGIVEPQDASAALVRSEARNHIAVLAGRPLGGLLFESSPVLPYIAHFISFVVSVYTLCFLGRSVEAKPEPRRAAAPAGDVFSGLIWAARDKYLRYALPLGSFVTFLSQALIIIFISDATTRHVSPVMIGFVLGASGVGGALGALVGGNVRIFSKFSRLALQLLIWAISFLALSVVTSSSRIWCMAVVMLLMSITGAMSNIELDTYVAWHAGDALARVTSIGRLLCFTAAAVGPAVGGVLAGTLGTHAAVLTLFAAALVLVAFGWSVPSIRSAPVPIVARPPAMPSDPNDRPWHWMTWRRRHQPTRLSHLAEHLSDGGAGIARGYQGGALNRRVSRSMRSASGTGSVRSSSRPHRVTAASHARLQPVMVNHFPTETHLRKILTNRVPGGQASRVSGTRGADDV